MLFRSEDAYHYKEAAEAYKKAAEISNDFNDCRNAGDAYFEAAKIGLDHLFAQKAIKQTFLMPLF